MATVELTVTLTVLYVVTMLVAFAGNMLLIYIVWKKPEVRSLTSSMFVNMAVADLLVTLVVMPYSIIHIYSGGKWLIVDDLAGEITCRAVVIIGVVTITTSILCLTLMAYDRYTAVMYPFRPLVWIRKAKFVAPLIWILSALLMSIVPVITDFNPETDMCGYNFSILGNDPSVIRGIFIYLFVVNYLLPLSITAILYIKTAHKLWFRQVPGNYLSQNQRQQDIARRRVVRMLVIVVAVFAFCWLPTQVFQLYVAVTNSDFPPYVMYLCYWLAQVNSAINPWLYVFLSTRLRSAFTRMVSRRFSGQSGRARVGSTQTTMVTAKLIAKATIYESHV